MKAMVVRQPGGIDAMRIESIPDPVAGPRDVVIKVEACGVCFHDVADPERHAEGRREAALRARPRDLRHRRRVGREVSRVQGRRPGGDRAALLHLRRLPVLPQRPRDALPRPEVPRRLGAGRRLRRVRRGRRRQRRRRCPRACRSPTRDRLLRDRHHPQRRADVGKLQRARPRSSPAPAAGSGCTRCSWRASQGAT